jgi:hypothetical protein
VNIHQEAGRVKRNFKARVYRRHRERRRDGTTWHVKVKIGGFEFKSFGLHFFPPRFPDFMKAVRELIKVPDFAAVSDLETNYFYSQPKYRGAKDYTINNFVLPDYFSVLEPYYWH